MEEKCCCKPTMCFFNMGFLTLYIREVVCSKKSKRRSKGEATEGLSAGSDIVPEYRWSYVHLLNATTKMD